VKTVVRAASLGVVATAIAIGTWAVGGANLTSLDWAAYDRWLRGAAPRPSEALVLVVRDRASESKLGAGSWDRAVHARLVTELSRAGALAIGLDVPFGQRSPAGRGGVSSDVMLSQATALAGTVLYPVALELTPTPGAPAVRHQSWQPPPAGTSLLEARSHATVLPSFLEQARAAGHVLAPADADGVVRRAPLFVRVGDRAVPAFGLLLAGATLRAPGDGISLELDRTVRLVSSGRTKIIPTDANARTLVVYAPAAQGPRMLSFSETWAAIQDGHTERLQEWFENRTVVALTEPSSGSHHTPDGRVLSELAIQIQLADTILTERWVREVAPGQVRLVTFVLAAIAAWLVLALPSWKGLLAAGVIGAAYATAVVIAPGGGLVLPAWVPLSAVTIATGGGLLWIQLGAAYRIRHLESEIARVEAELARSRDALVRQESAVESLEDDLEAGVRSADTLRAQLETARREEGATRQRLSELERTLRGLRGVERPRDESGDSDDERVRRECAEIGILTREPAVVAVFRDLKKAVRSSLPVLILGEPGTGKELFARAAHRLSRPAAPFVAVNVAAISPELFESELFGHVKGAFTGAIGDRRGYLELADRGTIFLDEIGELGLDQQSKLLRVLQEKSFYRVGATRPTAVDVRIVAASNRDLERGVAEGRFREDLFFRLKGVVLRLPPLRDRPADLPLLIGRFVEDAAREIERPGLRISEEAHAALLRQEWKGNVRELKHCITQAVALAEGEVVTLQDLRLPVAEPIRRPVATTVDGDAGSDATVLACLREHGFDMQATAAALDCDRSTVTQRLKGLGFRALVDSGGDRTEAARALAGDPALVRVVELKLREYHEHLLRAVAGFASADAAVAACRRRFKNLPDRHFRSLESLVRRHFGS
jgi:DNA-binding NtrC family response regulator/CHASE2 domain-containing sensor protein